MAEQTSYLIIGNGIAGVTAAEILRSEDSAAAITVVADDPFPVYYRPALKDYLAGRVQEDKLWARPRGFYEQHNIRFLRERVTGIQAGQHTVQLAGGRSLPYSRLLLTSGARASRLSCPGCDLQGVITLRTVADYQNMLSRLGTVRHIVVSGSGTLALETIETLRHRGYVVTHLLRKQTLWSEVLDATASDLVLQQERRDGIDVYLEEEIAEITGRAGQVNGVVTTNNRRISCELVVVAIGVEPAIDFIARSGIPCGRGVRVDAAMRTSAPDIYAAGDVLETTNMLTGRTRVIGQWYPAVQQARAAAYSMLELLDTASPFRSDTFYNATFLYGLPFASLGLTTIPRGASGYQELVAEPQPRSYRKVLLKDGRAVGMLVLGDRTGALAFKRAVDQHVDLRPVAGRLFARNFNLQNWLDAQGVPPLVLGVHRAGEAAIKSVAYTGANLPTLLNLAKTQPRSEAILVPLTLAELPSFGETLLSQTRTMTIGRQEGVYLHLAHSSISRRHAEISYANGQYILHDLGSTNGTFVNDKPLEPGSSHILQDNDQLRFGKTIKFVFRVRQVGGRQVRDTQVDKGEQKTVFYDARVAGEQAGLPPGQPMLAANGSLLLPGASSAVPAAVVATLKESPALIVLVRGQPEVFLLKQGKHYVLGRGNSADIALNDVVVSRRHAEVFSGPNGFYIRDLGSSNGVIVNATRIDNPYLLSHGDRITIGNAIMYFIDAGGRLGA